MTLSPATSLPKRESNFSKSYEEICSDRARNLMRIQDDRGGKLALLYSGGIDSTMVFISLLEAMGAREFKDRVTIYMTQDSINENPNLYFNFIRPNSFEIKSSTRFRYLFDGTSLVVGAEFNDQLNGSLLVYDLVEVYGDEIINRKFSIDFLKQFLSSRELSPLAQSLWINYFEKTLPLQDVGKIETVFDFFWWFNFIYKWQSVYFRMPLRVPRHIRARMSDNYLSNFYFHFFDTADFQQWSMNNPDLRIQGQWNTYKWHTKELIYKHTKDKDYRDHKLKLGSLYNLFLQNKNPIALTSHYEYLYNIDFDQYYDPGHSFK